MIDIVIVNFRRLHYLKALVQAIRDYTEFPHRVIVVDNCSNKETQRFIERLIFSGYVWKAVYNKENYLLPRAFSLGVNLVESKYCVLTCDDVIPPWSKPCWLTHLYHLIRNNKEYGAICLRHNKSQFNKYNISNRVSVPLYKSPLERFRGIEEFLRIHKTSDLRIMVPNPKTGEKEQLIWMNRHEAVYKFARRLRWATGKSVGKPTADFQLRTTIWKDPGLGYPKDIPESGKFV